MVLVFIILSLVILMSFIYFVLLISTIKLEIKKINITNINGKLKIKVLINIAIYILGKFKIFKINIDNKMIIKLLHSKKFNIEQLRNNKELKERIVKILRQESRLKIERLNLSGYYSMNNTVIACLMYSILNAIIPIIISRKIKYEDYINDIKFLNINQNYINISINCIISIKMVNIINDVLNLLIKKGGKNNGKSSNRRSYAYSYE